MTYRVAPLLKMLKESGSSQVPPDRPGELLSPGRAPAARGSPRILAVESGKFCLPHLIITGGRPGDGCRHSPPSVPALTNIRTGQHIARMDLDTGMSK